MKLGSKVIGSVGDRSPQYTPTIYKDWWNNPLIVTIDPNFQRDIPVGSGEETGSFPVDGGLGRKVDFFDKKCRLKKRVF